MEKTLLDLKNTIDEKLILSLEELDNVENMVAESMKYSLSAGGKRLRPLLLLTTFETFNNGNFTKDEIMNYALALEYIHTYSLIHDDLPAMDNDDLRRGKPTNHIVFGEACALLAGDGLLNFSSEIILKAIKSINASEVEEYKSLIDAFDVIANSCGVTGMIKGQMLDIFASKTSDNINLLKNIHKNKTGKLIYASIMAGAILANVENTLFSELEQIALLYGMIFQVEDDLLDYTSTTEVLGKNIGSDEKNDKLTYVTAYGIDETKNILEDLYNQFNELIEKNNLKETLLGVLFNNTLRRNY